MCINAYMCVYELCGGQTVGVETLRERLSTLVEPKLVTIPSSSV